MPSVIATGFRQDEILKPADVQARLSTLVKRDANVKLLAAEAMRRGFAPARGAQGAFGLRQTMKPQKPFTSGGETIKQVVFEMHAQEYTAPGSADSLALVTVSIRAGSHSEVYEMLLEAPGGNIARSREYMVRGGKVALAHSWWSRTKKCLKSDCVAVCVASLLSCSGTWIAYLGCVAAACGGCFTKCAACASCKCRIWCRWGVGCC